eukprot:COSAG06_NODE_18720_length_872_cov_0.724450_1_plen_36_part_01
MGAERLLGLWRACGTISVRVFSNIVAGGGGALAFL